MTRGTIVTLALALGVLGAQRATAHGLDPVSLTVREIGDGRFAVEWRASASRLPGANVQPVLPARCHQVGTPDAVDAGDRVALRWTVDCGPTDLSGETIGIDDLAAAKINGLLSIERRHGPPVQAVLSPRNPTYLVPRQPHPWEVARSYVRLGSEHIWSGPDHLLFVFGLLLLVTTTRLLVQTITAFTLGHSVTLSAAALGWATVPQRPVELAIAASVLLLAVELARVEAPRSLLRRYPWVMAALFGLLHGFGFAGALAEAGLPPADVPLALLAFNAGIEIGQLAFVAGVLLLGASLRAAWPGAIRHATRPAVHIMGTLAAFWCWERLAAWLG